MANCSSNSRLRSRASRLHEKDRDIILSALTLNELGREIARGFAGYTDNVLKPRARLINHFMVAAHLNTSPLQVGPLENEPLFPQQRLAARRWHVSLTA
jgi:hypothetical protein